MSDNNMKKKPYSYHTFMFPFLWNDGGKKTKRDSFVKCLNPKLWERDYKLTKKDNHDTLIENYNTYHYFNAAARNAVYDSGDEDAVVWCYSFNVEKAWNSTDKATDAWVSKPKGADNSAQYVICYKYQENGVLKSITRHLNINGIRLRLFNTGIGVLVFELENYLYEKPEEINWLNEYGRRIYMPFLQTKASCGLCAEEISIIYNGENITEGTLWGEISDFTETRVAAPITYLLSNDEYRITTKRDSLGKNEFFIEPIVDDRMFVACYYMNEKFAKELTEQTDDEYRYLSDATSKSISARCNCSVAWYKAIFIDGDGITCHSKSLLREMVERHSYDRWIEEGSLTGISEYSMVTVTSSNWDVLYRNFLTQYIEMMILALAQRASLLNFERMISDSAMGKRDICEIQDCYVKFQSQLLLKEVTPQQQGIELYKMLLENLFIQEQAEEIEKQIDSLSIHKSSKSETKENLILFMLAILGIFEAVNCLADWMVSGGFHWLRVLIAGVVSLAAVSLFLFYRRK